MPPEPPQTQWELPGGEHADEHGIVGIGADLEPGTLLAAYRNGLFPMPVERDGPIAWWSPDPRGVLELGDLRVSRSLRRSCARFEVRIDTSFAEVVARCADRRRPQGWIDDRIERAYVRLHEYGWAHSVETWRDGRLVGGLYGVAIGGLFAGESMFHLERDASKVALVALVELLGDGMERLIDVQWLTRHLATLGATEMPRSHYLRRLARLVADTPSPGFTAWSASKERHSAP